MYNIYRYIYFGYRKSDSIIYIEKAFFTIENFPKVSNFESNQPNESCGKCVEWTPVQDRSSGRQK